MNFPLVIDRTMSTSHDMFIFLLTEMNPRIEERTAKSFNSRVKWVEINDLKTIFVSTAMSYINKHNILPPQYPFRQKIRYKSHDWQSSRRLKLKTNAQWTISAHSHLIFSNNYFSVHSYTLVSLFSFENTRAVWKLSLVYSHLFHF